MSNEKNVEVVKNFLAALGRRDKQGLLALSAEDIEWIIPGEDWPLAGTHRGHAGLADLLQKANETVETSYPDLPEFIAQGDRVLVVGFATGRIKATNKTFEDHWVFAITVRNGKLTNVREYIDTQALARASQMDASGLADLTASKTMETSTEPREFIAQGDRVMVVGFARGKVKATNKAFEDHFVFAITLRDGKLAKIREYIDTQALARASETAASPRP
jgi:ketosteroid isomerase-like protein